MGTSDYNKEFLKSLACSRRHFWYSHRNEIIHRVIRRFFREKKIKILELGTGSGNIISYLSSKNLQVDGADIYRESLSYISQYAGKVFKYDLRTDPGTTEARDLKKNYEIVILADVIEHLEEAVLALSNAKYFCNDEGIVIITVPALAKLWSRYDSACGHKRRYDPDMLKSQMKAAGMDCVFIKHFFFFPSIILFLKRWAIKSVSKKTQNCCDKKIVEEEFRINAFFNFIFILICKIEFFVSKFLDLPFGSSIIAVGRVNR